MRAGFLARYSTLPGGPLRRSPPSCREKTGRTRHCRPNSAFQSGAAGIRSASHLRGVQRLMPNFALRLDEFTTERIWPAAPAAIPTIPESEAIARAYAMAAGFARAVGRNGPVTTHLTAGYDSRMVLAALGPEAAPHIPAITIALPNPAAALDLRVAGRLATRFGLRHQIRPFLPAFAADVALWHMRTGGCIADTVSTLSRTLASWPPDEIQLTGACGEVMRAFYWHEGDIGAPRPNAEELLTRLSMPRGERTLMAAEAWLETLPPSDAVRVWDLA